MGFFSSIGAPWFDAALGAAGGGGSGGGSKTYKQQWAPKAGSLYTDPGGASGVGQQFLDSLVIRGRSISNPGAYLDPFSGDKTTYNTPFLAGRFLSGEMGPGGYLSPSAQSRTTALGISGILRGSGQRRTALLNSLGASGLAPRYARAIAGQEDQAALDQAFNYTTQRAGETDQMRYEAMQAFINMMNQTAIAEKNAQLQQSIAKKGADAATKGSYIGAAANVISSVIPGIPGFGGG